MNNKELKDLVDALHESALRRREATSTTDSSIRGFTGELKSTQKLWRKGNRNFLIKAGLALIALPDPMISDIVGVGMVAAGLVQMKMKNSALHLEDVYKTFPNTMKEINSIKNGL